MSKILIRLSAALFVVLAMFAFGKETAFATTAYSPAYPGCVSTPAPPAATTSIACTSPSAGLFPAAGTYSGAGAPLDGAPRLIGPGETASQFAAVFPSTPGVYGVLFMTPLGVAITCQYGVIPVDINGDLVPDVVMHTTAINKVIGTSETRLQVGAISAFSAGYYELQLTVKYLGDNSWDVVCQNRGASTSWMLTAVADLGSPSLQTGAVAMRNVEVYDIAQNPLPVSAGAASATFIDLNQSLPTAVMLNVSPSGFVYEAPSTAVHIPGAAVRIETFTGSSWVPLHEIFNAPLMAEPMNPEITEASGSAGNFKWNLTVPGTYRLVVAKAGCTTATSSSFTTPPDMSGFNVGLTCADADADGMKDWRETGTGTKLAPGYEGTSPTDSDTDDDLILDGADNCPLLSNPGQENTDGNLIDMTPPFAVDDRTAPNSDNVGNACDSDDDNDGIDDADEGTGALCLGKVSDSTRADTDGDRYLDGAECDRGFDPGSAASKPALSACGPQGDADGDRLPDRQENCFYNTDPADVDSDDDRTTTGAADGCEVGSFNTDRIVNVADSAMLAGRAALGAPGYLLNLDLDKNGLLNVADAGILMTLRFPAGQCP